MNLKFYILLLSFITLSIQAQEKKKDYGRLFGGFETNAQRYLEFVNFSVAHNQQYFPILG